MKSHPGCLSFPREGFKEQEETIKVMNFSSRMSWKNWTIPMSGSLITLLKCYIYSIMLPLEQLLHLTELTMLKTLFSVMASQDMPAKNVNFKGIKFHDTAYTYMDPHGMPSGGDWALQRMGALFFEGTENVLVQECIFERLDGNAIMISGYNRNATIYKNEFLWIGDTAIAQWGYTSGSAAKGMGPDGTDGN